MALVSFPFAAGRPRSLRSFMAVTPGAFFGQAFWGRASRADRRATDRGGAPARSWCEPAVVFGQHCFRPTLLSALTGKGPATITPGVRRKVSSPTVGTGECPERQRGRTVNPLAMPSQVRVLLPPPSLSGDSALLPRRGCSSMVEQQPSKLNTRVRFPSPAPVRAFVIIEPS